MNAKILISMVVGILVILAGVGAYLYWPTNPQPPIVSNGKDWKDAKDNKDDPKKNNGTTPKPQPVVHDPAPVSIAAATEFLHVGPKSVQKGMKPDVIDARRAAALRGMILKDEKQPFPSVNVSIQHQPAYGEGHSRPDGSYDMVVNGGGLMTVGFKHEGYLPVWRQATVPWNDYVWLPPVVMSKVDSKVTPVQAGGKAIQTARGSKVKDADGERQATLLFQPGTSATMEMPNGKKQPLETLNVRATEYTVGAKGPDRMPAPLPANSAYTYCVELSIDEAMKAGAKTVHFDKPVVYHVENFLGFPVGIEVPAGYYDPDKGAWVASESGRVIKILDIKNGVAEIDIEGKGNAANAKALAALKLTDEERRELAKLYTAGTSLWRVGIPHFSIWDLNWAFSPPSDAVPPRMPAPKAGPPPAKEKPKREVIQILGTPWTLNFTGDRIPGADSSRTVRIPATPKTLPKSVKRVVIEIIIAGRRFEVELPADPDQVYIFVWDGKDAFDRPCHHSPTVRVRIGYVYDGVYERTPVFGTNGNGVVITGSRTRQELILWQEHQLSLGFFDARAFGIGGWSFDAQHAYDAPSRTLFLGNGERHEVNQGDLGHLAITTVAGGGKGELGDGGPALQARLDEINPPPFGGTPRNRFGWHPRGLVVAPDGSIFLTDSNNRVRKIDRDGIIRTVAGGGEKEADSGKATDVKLLNPRSLALAPDGSLYIGETYFSNRILRLNPDGTLALVAGGKKAGSSGDGGPATKAKLNEPTGLAVAPDGTLYIADQGNHRIRRISPDGVITTIAGTGKQGYTGDSGPAIKAQLYWPTSLAIAPDGSLYFSDQGNYIVRRISSSGIITTVAGVHRTGWTDGFGGDDGPATKAVFNDPVGVAVGPDGSVTIADLRNHRIRVVGPDGIIRPFAGAKSKHGGGDFAGDHGPARDALLSSPSSLAFGPDGSLYFYDASTQRGEGTSSERHIRQRIRRIAPPIAGFSNREIAVPSPDGKELFKFNAFGQHLETLDAAGKEARVKFKYDKAGRLQEIADQAGNRLRIERDDKGVATALVDAKARKTGVTLDEHGYLQRLILSDGTAVRMTHSPDGVLKEVTRAK